MRLIDADALHDISTKLVRDDPDGDYEYVWMSDINKMPTVDAVPDWIPVDDRLPEHENHVLCCTITAKGRKNIVIGYYHHALGRWASGMNSNVIAWMELPEPYNGGGE